MKHLTPKELRESGLLHEINRLLLHPVGLSMVTTFGMDAVISVLDFRATPEGVHPYSLSAEKATAVANLIEERGPARLAELGYVVQPLPPEVKQLHVTVKEVVGLPPEMIEAPEPINLGEIAESVLAEHDVSGDPPHRETKRKRKASSRCPICEDFIGKGATRYVNGKKTHRKCLGDE